MKVLRRSRFLIAVLVVSFVFTLGTKCGVAQQAPVKIGFIDLDKINDKWDRYRSTAEQLKTLISTKRKELMEKNKVLMNEYNSFRLKKELLPSEEASQKELSLKQEAQALKDKETDEAKAVDDKKKELLNPLMKELDAAVEQIAKADGFTFVFERRMLFYVSKDPSLDLTDRVLVLLNKK